MKYALHGITLALPFSCPELPPSEEEADVEAGWGKIDAPSADWNEEGVCFKAAPGRYLLSVQGVADFLVEDGRKITIEPHPEGEQERIRLHFFGEVMAALLWARGNLVARGCVVEKEGKGIAFVGPSPCGKTMTAAWLASRGFRVVSDGFFSLDGNGMAMPGSPRLMLWEKSLEKLGISREGLVPVRSGMNRFYLPLENSFSREPVRLESIFVISFRNGPGLSVVRAKGAKKMFSILDNRYRPELAAPFGTVEISARIAATVAKRAEVGIFGYNDTLLPFAEYAELLLGEMS